MHLKQYIVSIVPLQLHLYVVGILQSTEHCAGCKTRLRAGGLWVFSASLTLSFLSSRAASLHIGCQTSEPAHTHTHKKETHT